MSLNDFFDKIYCINLDRRPDRWEASQKEFDRIGIQVERFSAIEVPQGYKEGADPFVDPTEYEAWGYSSLSERSDPLLPGEYGIRLSHAFLLDHLIWDVRTAKNVLILEDDIEFSPTFNEDWDKWSKEIPDDWDMLYLGGNLVGWQPSPVTEHVHKGEGIFAIHALALNDLGWNHSGFWQFAKLCCQLPAVPVDVAYAQMSTRCKSYMMVPRMAFQRIDYSDIQNAPANYQFLKYGQFPEVMGR